MAWIPQALDPRHWTSGVDRTALPAELATGLIAGVVVTVLSVSMAALIFSGGLAADLPSGLAAALIGDALACAVVGIGSSVRLAVGSSQETVSAPLAVAAAAIAGTLAVRAPARVLPTVLVAIAVTSLAMGVGFVGLGTLRLGRLVRYIPYPVVGGFLAGTGWVLAAGGVGVMADMGTALASGGAFAGFIARVAPGLALAVVLLAAQRRFTHPLTMPVTLAAAVALFYGAASGVALSRHATLGGVIGSGWLLGPFQAGGLLSHWRPPGPNVLTWVDWGALVGQSANIATVLVVSAIALLLNVTGMELELRRDVDADHELRVAGIGNLMAGLAGGLGGFHMLGGTVMAHRAGARSRVVGITAALTVVATLLLGAATLAAVPKFVVGGLLVVLGLDFLIEWIYRAWFRLPRVEYALVVVIALVIAIVGFLPGVLLGLLAALVLFVVDYGRTSPVKHALTGITYQGAVDRPPSHRRLLLMEGERLFILELQGFLFFGSANSVVERARRRMDDGDRPALRFLLLDFRRVTGVDTSAVFSFTRLAQLARARDVTLVFTDLAPGLERAIAPEGGEVEESGLEGVELEGPKGEGGEVGPHFADLDRGVEWCENRLLADLGAEAVEQRSVAEQIAERLSDPDVGARLAGYLERLEVPAGEVVMRQGDHADALYFVASGRVAAMLDVHGGKPVRLRSSGAGTLVGEMGVYLGVPRTAMVVAEEPTVLYRLTAATLRDMRTRDPESAAACHELVAGVLAERVAQMNATVAALLE